VLTDSSTPAISHCIKIEESHPEQPGEEELKYYAPGIGLVRDGPLKLLRYGKIEPGSK
jgi:hypothetical protein